MRILRVTTQISLCFVLILATNAAADIQEASSCLRNGTERHVELRSDSPNSVPCQVVYVRKSEQVDDKVLWFANSDANYCKTQYNSFLVKLETKLKWTCTAEVIDGSASSAPATVAPASVVTPKVADVVVNNVRASTIAVDDVTVDTAETSSVTVEAVVDDSVVEYKNTAELIEPQRQLEPKLQAALPITPIANSSRPELTAAPEPKPLTRATLEFYFPSGFYTLDSTALHAGNTSNCPQPGYFVWNTRDPVKPVFEMGATLEFELNIAELESSVEAPIITLPLESSDGVDFCTTHVSLSACQYPDFRQGSDSWQTNNGSFDCGRTSTTEDKRHVSFALFQNREQVPDTATCPAQNQVVHMALAALSQGYQNAVKQRTNAIELAMSTGKGQKLNRCRYVRRIAQ